MISDIELQSDTAQDMVRTGDNWMVVCDGHGSGRVINHLRTLDWEEVILEDGDGKRHGAVRHCSRDSRDANVWVDWADGTSTHVPAALLVPGAPTQRRPAQSRRRRKPEPDSTSSESEPELESESDPGAVSDTNGGGPSEPSESEPPGAGSIYGLEPRRVGARE